MEQTKPCTPKPSNLLAFVAAGAIGVGILFLCFAIISLFAGTLVQFI